jgi:hypothetical protein
MTLAHAVTLVDEVIAIDGVVVGEDLREDVGMFEELRPRLLLMWGLTFENFSDLRRYRDWMKVQSSPRQAALRRLGLFEPDPPVGLGPELVGKPESLWLPYLGASEELLPPKVD